MCILEHKYLQIQPIYKLLNEILNTLNTRSKNLIGGIFLRPGKGFL
jgi:hypothetical protein